MLGRTLQAHNVRSLDDRVRLLQGLVWLKEGGLRDPTMRALGLAVTQGCPARDDMCELEAIFNFVVGNIRYTGDITTKDTFCSALRTLQFGGGDCDDHSVLAAVLAMENGFSVKWRITSNTGASWDHIYAMAGVPKMNPRVWVPIDTTLGRGKFNKQPGFRANRDFVVAREG